MDESETKVVFRTADWVRVPEENGEEHFKCSNCGMVWFLAFGNPLENEMNFCPRCGIKMEAVVDEKQEEGE